MKILFTIIQVLALIAFAPLVGGAIRKIKNVLRMRRGAGVLQPYYNLMKLFSKDEVISENSSWIFRAAPYVMFASAVMALALVPAFFTDWGFNRIGDLLLIIYLLALGRFFVALAGLDCGSAFGGMGSSREMFISSLIEPVMLLSIFTVSLNCGSTNPAVIYGQHSIRFSTVIASAALFIVMLAETSRIPVDNQETHLELTMVHEAMVLEYSGRSLALIELASYVKQMLFFTILANVVFPTCVDQSGGALRSAVFLVGMYLIKVSVLSIIIALLEVSVPKMRLFRVVDLASFALVISIAAAVVSALGI